MMTKRDDISEANELVNSMGHKLTEFRFIILAAGGLLAACSAPVESRFALSEPGQVTYDSRILGTWASKKTSPRWYLSLNKSQDQHIIDVIGSAYDRGEKIRPVRWIKARAFASEVGGKIYFNAQRLKNIGDYYGAPGVEPGYILLTLILKQADSPNKSLWGCFMSHKLIGGLISKQVILGEEIRAKYQAEGNDEDKVPYYRINSDQQSLRGFIGKFTPSLLFDQCLELYPSNEFPELQ